MIPEENPIKNKLEDILSKLTEATTKSKREGPIRLVAVSKTKSVEEIQKAYDCGIRNFGESYVDEIE